MTTRVGIVVVAACACSTSEPAMSAPIKILSTFTQLTGGSAEYIPPGDRLVALGGRLATWWDASNKPIEAALPVNTFLDGARWSSDGTQLHVGLGALDLATRTWRA
ncbi:MAG TPA: hypothetical protein VGO00_16725, partial [Kofleriaceae bacterium]|nr:hypothetical protein [Kofleriaceae bacterium]